MSTITTSGIVRDLRHHIWTGEGWSSDCGTDFWMICAVSELTSANAAGKHTLDTHGWTATAITEAGGADGDFLSSSDDDPSNWTFGAASDLLESPVLFGSYAHALMVRQHLGVMPTELNMEVYAQFTDDTNNETASGFGFTEGGGSIITANDALAVIHSDGTNYKLRSGAATTAAGAAVDTAWHLWRIKVNASGCWFYMDGTLQNSTLLALEADEFPVSFGIGVQAAGANFQKLAWAHVWYA